MKLLQSLPYIALLLTTQVANIKQANSINVLAQSTNDNYYYNQLITEDSKRIYNALDKILKEDKFKTGDYTIDLVKEGFLENREYNQNKLISDFAAAKDCFRFDNPEIFYVDFSKLSIRQIQNGTTYRINLGIGREDNYFYEGYNKDNINQIISSTNNKIDEIITLANAKKTITEKLDIIYSEVISSATYALETTAKPDNKYYVRSPYGTLVKGEALCEGFATTTKIILDKLSFTSVLAQGMFSYQDKTELHMWNYIQMEDSRWYLLDSTMDNGLKEDGTTRNYFLKTGKDEVSTSYLPDGTISVSSSSSFSLRYPTLSNVAYKENANYFKFSKDGEKTFASYLGMGIQESMNKGKYIIYTYDVDSMKTGWKYYAQSHAVMQVMAGYEPKLSDIDQAGKFDISLIGDVSAVFAVTDIKPKYTFEEIVANKKINPADYSYTGSLDNIYDYSNVNGSTPLTKGKPYAIDKSYGGTSLEENKSYNVTIKYSENLKKIYPNESIEVIGSNLLGEVKTSNVIWDDKIPNQISFTFSTVKSFYRNLGYYFTLTNLIGETSHESPLETGFNVINNVEFACPKVEGAINTVYTNKPALIEDGDMSSAGWTDKNGQAISSSLPFRLALVASKHDEEKAQDMTQKIEDTGEKILKSSTFELNLQLCGAQVAFLNGNKLKVLMPFPEGYGPNDNGVTFKAYHFKQDGTPEIIESTITEHGLIMYVDAFSPFAIIATEGKNETKDVAIQINGNATTNTSLLKLKNNESKEVSILLKEGNAIDYVSLNDKILEVKDNKVNISYSDLKDFGNVLEINTVIKSILDKEIEDGFHSTEINSPTTPDIPKSEKEDNSSLIKIISISVSVGLVIIGGIVCFVAYKKNKQIKK